MVTGHNDTASPAFRALADPTRRAILVALRGRPLAVRDISSRFEISRPAISRHLKILRTASLVHEHRAGREHRYACNPGPLEPVRRWLDTVWTNRLADYTRVAEGATNE